MTANQLEQTTQRRMDTLMSAAVVAAFSLSYVVLTCWIAARKQLWTDELYVYNLMSLPTFGALWRSLAARPDAMPPFTHVAAYAITRVIGLNALAVRLPAVFGFWLCSVAIYFFLRRRVSLPLAAIGMLLPLTVPFAYDYASEARGYGLMLGFCAAAVFFWDLAGDRWRRSTACVALALSLAAAVASHLFAVLVVAPLAAAEITRSWARGRINWSVWIGMLASTLIVIPLWSTLPNTERIGRLASPPQGPGLTALGTAWNQLLSTPLTYLGIACVLAISLRAGTDARRLAGNNVARPLVSTSDWMLVTCLICLPLIGFVATHLASGALLARYLLPTIIGFSLGVPLLCSVVGSRTPVLGLVAWVAASALLSVAQVKHQMAETGDIVLGRGIFSLLAHADAIPNDGLPILVSDYHAFMALDHYATPVLRERLAFCPDYEAWILPDAELHVRLYGQAVEPLESFVQKHRSFYLYDCDTVGHVSPVLPRLVLMGARLDPTSLIDPGNTFPRPGYLFLVTGLRGVVVGG
jgi:hypothetical protein